MIEGVSKDVIVVLRGQWSNKRRMDMSLGSLKGVRRLKNAITRVNMWTWNVSVVYSNNRRKSLIGRVTISAIWGLVKNSKGTNDKREWSDWIGASVVEGSK